MTQLNSNDVPESLEHLKQYHQLQYERIDKLESQRYNFSNLVLTLTTGVLAFGYKEAHTNIKVLGIYLSIIIGNIIAVIFIHKTRRLIKMHQKRAKEAREIYAPSLNRINEKVGKPESNNNFFNRSFLHVWLHVLFVLVILMIIGQLLFKQFNCNF